MSAAVDAACDACLARAWLISRLAGHLEHARGRIQAVLALDDGELIEAVAGRQRDEIRREWRAFDASAARERCRTAAVETVCRCRAVYPPRLRAIASPPAVLHVAGGLRRFLALAQEEPVAIVGARRASDYGLEVADALGRGLSAAAVTVVSGMAAGIDSAAHHGALDGGGRTIAVLPGPVERPYPAGKRALHGRIRAQAAAVSELPPGSAVWRWMFPARNRVIAGLATMTIVVEAGERSGALLTAAIARSLDRPVGAVPGRVTAPLAAGPNRLLASGADLVRDAQDVLDAVFGAGARSARPPERSPLDPDSERLLRAISELDDTSAALHRAGLGVEEGLTLLAGLELSGYIRRRAGGRYAIMP